MSIRNADQLTQWVVSEMGRAEDKRTRELLVGLVEHLHSYVREVGLTESEFQKAIGIISRLGQMTTESHNEVALAAGSTGVSALVCLINNGNMGKTQTTANLMGPFWRDNAPMMKQGESIVRSASKGAPVFVSIQVLNEIGEPVEDALVDVWQCSEDGFYENQDPNQADMNLRGRFLTDAKGEIKFRSIKPIGYPIPLDGPVGDLVRVLGRHNMRPAHIHFLINKQGYKTQFSQVYSDDDPNIDTDVQFGVTEALTAHYTLHHAVDAPTKDIVGDWYSMSFKFFLEKGVNQLPKPPISSKTTGGRPELVVLTRRK